MGATQTLSNVVISNHILPSLRLIYSFLVLILYGRTLIPTQHCQSYRSRIKIGIN